jgi:hypothetical protein
MAMALSSPDGKARLTKHFRTALDAHISQPGMAHDALPDDLGPRGSDFRIPAPRRPMPTSCISSLN